MDFDLKRGRFLLLKSNVHLDDRGKARNARLKEANEDVYTAYLLKEQVIAFYEQKSKGELSGRRHTMLEIAYAASDRLPTLLKEEPKFTLYP